METYRSEFAIILKEALLKLKRPYAKEEEKSCGNLMFIREFTGVCHWSLF
jgi:hypothetical protein